MTKTINSQLLPNSGYIQYQEKMRQIKRNRIIGTSLIALGLTGAILVITATKNTNLNQYPTRTISVDIAEGKGYNSATRQAIQAEPGLDKYSFWSVENYIEKLNQNKTLQPGENQIRIPDLP